MGRPSKYTEDTIPQTLHYLANYEEIGDAMPSVAGLAVYLEVSRSSIYEWADDPEKSDFSDILETLLAKQEQVLFNRGLRGDYNAAITKLALGKHGYSDKQDTAHTSPDGSMSPTKTASEMTEDELREEARKRGLPASVLVGSEHDGGE